jgi:hypothetical protein
VDEYMGALCPHIFIFLRIYIINLTSYTMYEINKSKGETELCYLTLIYLSKKSYSGYQSSSD